jgi:hypothetical protein
MPRGRAVPPGRRGTGPEAVHVADVRGNREQPGLAGLQESQVDEDTVVAPDVDEEPPIAVAALDIHLETDAPSCWEEAGRERGGAPPLPPDGGGVASRAADLTDELFAVVDLRGIDPDEPDPLLSTVREAHDHGVSVDDPSNRASHEAARLGRRRTGIPVTASGRHPHAGPET